MAKIFKNNNLGDGNGEIKATVLHYIPFNMIYKVAMCIHFLNKQ